MTEEEFYEKILDAENVNFQGEIYEFLGMTEQEYRDKIHCRWCKSSELEKRHCEPFGPYCCSYINMENN